MRQSQLCTRDMLSWNILFVRIKDVPDLSCWVLLPK